MGIQRWGLDLKGRVIPVSDGGMVSYADHVASVKRLREALGVARSALNLGLNIAYEKGGEDKSVRCGICHGKWPIVIHEDRTAGANIEHDPTATCGIMQVAMYGIDAALEADK